MTMTSVFHRSALALALFGGATLLAGVASAQTPGDGRPAGFLAELDTNQDGAVSLQEFQAARLDDADALDTNRDGIVTHAEMKVAHEKMAEQRFIRGHDQDGDGRVSVAELTARKAKFFEYMDRDGDGQVTAEEMKGGKHRGAHGHRGPRTAD